VRVADPSRRPGPEQAAGNVKADVEEIKERARR
jgi:hypothetical protein